MKVNRIRAWRQGGQWREGFLPGTGTVVVLERGGTRPDGSPTPRPGGRRGNADPFPTVATHRIVLILALGLATAGCQSMGPRNVSVDRFNYNEAIATSSNEQLLLNMVRLRYGENLTFVDVTQVITQYRREAGLDLGGDVGFSEGGSVDGGVSGKANARWSDQPTITYAPRTGAEFTSSLLTPIRPVTVFALFQADWPSEQLLRRVVRSINGVAAQDRTTGQWNPQFTVMLRALARVQARGALGLASRPDPESPGGRETGTTPILRFRDVEVDSATAADLDQLRRIWNLAPDISEYSLVFGVIPEAEDQIAVLTNSVYEILRDLSDYISVPQAHIDAGRTRESTQPPPSGDAPGRPPVEVRVSAERPSRDFVSVEKDGWWYYIDGADFRSKQMFSLVSILLQLSEAGEEAAVPILAIGAGW